MNRIVVIEDDPAIRRGLADNLRKQSYDVLSVADGEDGYRLVRDNPPDLVILDLMLPGMSGYEVCRQIRDHGIATPILMLTAQNHEADRVQGFDTGADDYVTKPFSIGELLGRVRAILRRSEGRSDLANQKELDDARHIQQRLMPGNPGGPHCWMQAPMSTLRLPSNNDAPVLRRRLAATGRADAASNSRVVFLIPSAGGTPRKLQRVPAQVQPEDLSNENLGQWVRVLSWAPDSRTLLLRKTVNGATEDAELQAISINGQEL